MDAATMAKVGANMKNARQACGLSRRQVAEYCGVSLRKVKAWEQGKTPDLDLSLMQELCNLFGCRLSWLTSGSGETMFTQMRGLEAEDLRQMAWMKRFAMNLEFLESISPNAPITEKSAI